MWRCSTSLLDKFENPEAFERLCCEVLLKTGYADITPVGGTADGGRDGEETLYEMLSGKRKTLLQFTLRKDHRAKIRETLKRIREAGIAANELIIIFSTRIHARGPVDTLIQTALHDDELEVDVKDQRYLSIRLGQEAFREITREYFASEIDELLKLWQEDRLFVDSECVSEADQRCLVNLMHFGRHPLSPDLRQEVIRQAIRRVLGRTPQHQEAEYIVQMVADYLPAGTVGQAANVACEIEHLVQEGDILVESGKYWVSPEVQTEVALETAAIASGRETVHAEVMRACRRPERSITDEAKVRAACDHFFAMLFKEYGNEVASVILDEDTDQRDLGGALGPTK